MNILVLTNQLPWPPTAGGQASQFASLKALEADHQFRIVLSSYEAFSEDNAKALEASLLSTSVVRPDNSKIFSDTTTPLTLASISRSLLYKSYAKIKNSLKRQPRSNHQSRGTSFERPYFPFNRLHAEVLEYISRNLAWADLIQAEFHENLFLGLLSTGGKPRLFICHQAHGAYTRSFYVSRATSKPISNNITPLVEESDINAAIKLESCLMNEFDHIVVFSGEDKSSLINVDQEKVTVSPFPLPSDVRWTDPFQVDYSFRKIAFVGPGFWHPNVDAIEWLIHKALPALIQIRPTFPVKLHIAGNWNPQQMARLKSDMVIFEGFVDDLAEFLQGSISVNPIFVGAGLRTKLLSAAASASPIVSSSLGAEGTGFVHRQHCIIANSPEDFASSIVSLYDNPSVAKEYAVAAFKHVKNHFSQEAVRRQRNFIYSKLKNTLS